MKKLMAHQSKPGEVVLPYPGVPAAGHKDGRVLVLETAPRLGDHIEEDVLVVRQEPPHVTVRTDDVLYIPG